MCEVEHGERGEPGDDDEQRRRVEEARLVQGGAAGTGGVARTCGERGVEYRAGPQGQGAGPGHVGREGWSTGWGRGTGGGAGTCGERGVE